MMKLPCLSQIQLELGGINYVAYTLEDNRIIGAIFLEREMYEKQNLILLSQIGHYKNIINLQNLSMVNYKQISNSYELSIFHKDSQILELNKIIIVQHKKINRNKYLLIGVGVVALILIAV